jgi:hypothetical protein
LEAYSSWRAQVDTFENHGEEGGIHFKAGGAGGSSGELDAAAFETSVVDDKSGSVKEEDFQLCSRFIEEDKEIAGKGVPTEPGADQAGKSIEGEVKIDRLKGKKDTNGSGKGQHERRRLRSLARVWSWKWSSTRRVRSPSWSS